MVGRMSEFSLPNGKRETGRIATAPTIPTETTGELRLVPLRIPISSLRQPGDSSRVHQSISSSSKFQLESRKIFISCLLLPNPRAPRLKAGLMKQEKLAWVADNPPYAKRLAFFAWRRCSSIDIEGWSQATAFGLADRSEESQGPVLPGVSKKVKEFDSGLWR